MYLIRLLTWVSAHRRLRTTDDKVGPELEDGKTYTATRVWGIPTGLLGLCPFCVFVRSFVCLLV